MIYQWVKKVNIREKIWQYVAYGEALFMETISTNWSMVNFNCFLKILQWIVLNEDLNHD